MYELLFLQALGTTVGIEYLILTVVLFLYRVPFSWHQKLTASVFSTGMTLPYLWFILPYFGLPRLWYIGVGEVWVWIMETVFYFYFFRIDFKKALLLSALCNLISFVIGLLL